MVANVYKWRADSASANANADSDINWNEGQSPGTVNDSARGMMQGIAAWRDQLGGVVLATGTGSPYAITTGAGHQPSPTDPKDGLRVSFRVPSANTGAVSLLIDSLPSKPLRRALTNVSPAASSRNLAPNELRPGVVYEVAYAATPGEYVLLNPPLHPGIAAAWATMFFPPGTTGNVFVQSYNIDTIVYSGSAFWTVTFKNPLGTFPAVPVGTNPNFHPYTVTGSTSGLLTYSTQNKTATAFNFRIWFGTDPSPITGGGDGRIGGIGFFADFVVFSTIQY
jgi:hypothetical protein